MKALQQHRAKSAPPLMLAFETLGISDADVARAYSVSRPMVSAWRHGTRPIPRPRRIEMLAFLTVARDGFAEDVARHNLTPNQPGLVRWVATQERNRRVLDKVLQAEITPDLEQEVRDEAARVRKHLVPKQALGDKIHAAEPEV